jgi:hypothetical protein
MLSAALALLQLLSPAPVLQPEPFDFVPVGVRYDLDRDPVRRRRDLENMRRLRFTVVAARASATDQTLTLTRIDRLLAGAQDGSIAVPASSIGTVRVDNEIDAARLREMAWTRLASGDKGVIFEDWNALQGNDAAFAEAAAFAETLARNPALYAPLRRIDAAGDRALSIDGGQSSLEARWLESGDALLLIAINHAAEPRDVTIAFTPAMPEAVWQNMLTGTAVNFVAGPAGPLYSHTFAPHEVLVLMIRKRWR